MNQYMRLSCIVILAALATTQVRGNDLFWTQPPPVSNNLGGANYFDNTTATANVAPTGTDILFIGAGGNVTHATGTLGVQKLRIGHVMGGAAYQGAGTVTVNNGAQVNLTLVGGGADASLIIGGGAVATTNSGFSGTLNIDGAGSKVTSAQLVQIGFGSRSAANANATVNITNGGSLVATTGNINLGERNGGTGAGLPGHINISGATSSLTVATASADLNIGVRAASSYDQTGGVVSIGDDILVGLNNAHGSSFAVSGGSVASKSITIGVTANNAIGSITGTAVVNVTGTNFNVGDDDAQGASLTVADGADINITSEASGTGNMFIGLDTSTGTTFTMTGGTIDTGRNFLLGTASGATGIVGNQSGGTITTRLNFVVGDTFGASTYNLSANGVIDAKATVNIGRQTKTASGTMNQTGGSISSALSFNIGNAEDADTTLWGTGIYNISAGTITANQTTGTAFTIGRQGTGTLRVIGDDGIIDINGNMTVSAAGAGKGTLTYQFETGDLLSLIDVSGNATFNSGAILTLDDSIASPTQTSYDLLTALDIIDNGIAFSGPAGWSYSIVPGLNGEILRVTQAVAGLPGDFNNDTKVDAADYVTWRANEVANAALPNDNSVGNQADRYTLWRANFGNPGAGGGLGAGQVPEPTAAVLFLVGILTLAVKRRRSDFVSFV